MQISLPDSMEPRLREKAKEAGFSSAETFVLALISREVERGQEIGKPSDTDFLAQEREFQEELLREGLVDRIKPEPCAIPADAFKLVVIPGKPLSESIIEDRR